MNDYGRSDHIRNDKRTERLLHTALAEGAASMTPGPLPADAVFAGARRRTLRARFAGTAAGVAVLAGAAGVVAVGRTGTDSGPASADGTAPAWIAAHHTPSPGHWPGETYTVDQGLPRGRPMPQPASVPFDGATSTVVVSGTVDGHDWWFQALTVNNPPKTDPYWGGLLGSEQSEGTTCTAVRLTVGSTVAAPDGGCVPVPPEFRVVGTFRTSTGTGPLDGGIGATVFAQVPPKTARVVWDFGDGRTMDAVLVAVDSGRTSYALFPLIPQQTGTITAYDATGHKVGGTTL